MEAPFDDIDDLMPQEEQPAPQQQPAFLVVPRDDLDWSQFVDRNLAGEPEHVENKKWCFWRERAQAVSQIANSDAISRLIKFHEDNYHRATPFDYARQMQDMYNKYVRPYMVDPRNKKRTAPGPPWHGRSIYEYALESLHPRSLLTDMLHTFRTINQAYARNTLFQRDTATGETTIDEKKVSNFVRFAKEYRAAIAQYASLQGASSVLSL